MPAIGTCANDEITLIACRTVQSRFRILRTGTSPFEGRWRRHQMRSQALFCRNRDSGQQVRCSARGNRFPC